MESLGSGLHGFDLDQWQCLIHSVLPFLSARFDFLMRGLLTLADWLFSDWLSKVCGVRISDIWNILEVHLIYVLCMHVWGSSMSSIVQ